MKRLLPVLIPIAAAGTACDLSGTGIFVQLPNGKFNYGDEYKIRTAKKDGATGQFLENPGKPAKSRGRLGHKKDGEFSDAWVTCKKNKFSSYLIKCKNDGSFEINGKSGDDITLPSCDPIGCDPTHLEGFNSKLYEKSDGCRVGYFDGIDGNKVEKNKNVCYRRCGENFEVRSKKKIRCTCDYATKLCEYQINANKDLGWVNWKTLKTNGQPFVPTDGCQSDPTEPPVTDEPDPEFVFGAWSEWNACSAGCGTGQKQRSRTCESGECQGPLSETQNCTGPDGTDCPMGCKLTLGDFSQTSGKSCAQMFRGPDGYYLPRGGKCVQLECDSETFRQGPQTWTCSCTNSGKCQLKVSQKTLADSVYTDNFNPVTDCELLGKRVGGVKVWRWADGRRSAAQPAEEVSGGADWELLDICYDRDSYVFNDWKAYIKGINDLPFESRFEWTGSVTYGRVVETDDGRLVCQFSNPKYDWSDESDMYYQLAIKTGKVSWQSSERFWMFQENRHGQTGIRHPTGEFYHDMMIFQPQDFPSSCCDIRRDDADKWIDADRGDEVAHRAICRVQDSRDGKWYVGALGAVDPHWGHSYISSVNNLNFDIKCIAFAADGTKLWAKAHNRHFRTEANHPEMLKSEYLVIGGDDGTQWGQWSEWSACTATCGWDSRRLKTRDCTMPDGQVIDYKTSMNCLQTLADRSVLTDTIKGKCLEDENIPGCEDWGRWARWTECTATCDGGTQTRDRTCDCCERTSSDSCQWTACVNIDHPLITGPNMCGDGEVLQSQECGTDACPEPTEPPMTDHDGVGPGCRSDTYYMNTSKFKCIVGDTHESNHSVYENEFGFVPHGTACYAGGQAQTCSKRLSHLEPEQVSADDPAVCLCHDGHCSWTPNRQDCSRGYEWIRLPVGPDHPEYDNIVDAAKGGKTKAVSAIAITDMMDRRRTILPTLKISDDGIFRSDTPDTFILVNECSNGGSIEWREGPYDCDGALCPSLYPRLDNSKELSEPELADFFNTSFPSWQTFEIDYFGPCRIKGEDEWIMGTLIRYTEASTTYRPYQCCPLGGNQTVAGCSKSYPYGDYDRQPYQVIFSGSCHTEKMARWSSWGDWSICSKNCGSGSATGTRSRSRTCTDGEVGELGCSDSTITSMSEPCNMAQPVDCNDKRCKLDVNFIDWYRFRMAHVDGVKNTEFWTENGVYYNRREDLHHEPRDWTGYFPEGTKVSGYRCVNPNTNRLYPDQHDATCVCSEAGCDWDREMPSCSNHETDHPGYTWTMEVAPKQDTFCVSAIFGGVGVVKNGKCHITMSPESNSYYFDTTQYHDRPSRDLFRQSYPSFNTYFFGTARDETEFHSLSSTCPDGLKWISAAEASASNETVAVHLPSTYTFWHQFWDDRWERERSFLCRMNYEGDKTCYGRFINGKCNGYNNESQGYENVTIEVLSLDADPCPIVAKWSDCSGENGRPANCGPGTQTRTTGTNTESRTCLGTCETMQLFETAFTHPDPEPKFQCTRPSYPTHSNWRDEHIKHTGSPLFAKFPIRKDRFTKGMNMKCTANSTGFWHTDYLTGDEYYSMGVDEKCIFGCDDSFFKIEGVGHSKNINYAECGKLGKHNLQFDENENFPSCLENFCVFPSFGKGWFDKKMDGTTVQLGVECSGNHVDNGDHVIAQAGVACQLVCRAENGKPYRVDTQKDNFKCADPLPPYVFNDNGCPVGDHWAGLCVSDWIEQGLSLRDKDNRMPWTYRAQTRDYPAVDMTDMAADDRLNKCYKVQGDSCPTEVPLNNDEISAGMTTADVIYDCNNGNQPGSVCKKTCGVGFNPSGPKQTKTCECTKKCNWKGAVASCEPAKCPYPDDPWWPDPISCFDKNDNRLDFQDSKINGFPQGAYCKQECSEHWIYDIWQADQATCECSAEDGRCKFDNRKVNSCTPAVCNHNLNYILSEFSLGFDHPSAKESHFATEIECDNLVPSDHPDKAVAGFPLLGSSCYIKCKEGFKFADHSEDRFKITCTQQWDHDVEWDIFHHSWDKYGDCDGDYGYECDAYPQCVPEFNEFTTTMTTWMVPEEEG